MGRFLRNDVVLIMKSGKAFEMLNRQTFLMIGLTLILGACSTVDGFFTDIGEAFRKGDAKTTGAEINYVDPLPDGTLPEGANGVIAPTSQMDLSYERIAASSSSGSVELFSLENPGQPLQPSAYDTTPRQTAGTGDYGVEGVASSTDDSVTIFPFSNDMYTPGVKAGLPAFRGAPAGYNYADGTGSGPSIMAYPATQIEDIPLSVGSPDIVYFNHGSAALGAVAREVIARVAADNHANRVIVEAHASKRAAVTDPARRAEVNHRMSMQRAMAVTRALIAQGIPEHMIKTTALGDTKPAVPEVDRESEAMNRRVEILSRP